MQTQFPGDLGPLPTPNGILYRVWAYGHRSVVAHIEKANGKNHTLRLEPADVADQPGYFFGVDPEGIPGDLYKFRIDDEEPTPDFVSHFQPQGVDGPSMVVNAADFEWRATGWQRPSWSGQVVCECHIGTLTQEGTYRAAIEKLDHFAALGVTALEVMPVAESAGERNWGYDGVYLFAPYHPYGTPDDFRRLIDACHQRGLSVLLDLVYNHLGPVGNYSHRYSDYFFHQGRDNPWGQNFNLDGPHSHPVRALLRQNIRYWLDEFRIDGFRMDATHTIHDPSIVHLLAEAAEIVHSRGGFIVAEDDRNSRMILEPQRRGGWDFDALWSDDFHHIMRVTQTGERHYFFSMFQGSADEVVRTLQQGWFYAGQVSPFHKKPRGTPGEDFPPESFVYCISNHDQVGNRLLGDRLHQSITPAGYRALSLFLCLVPATPLIFMGQEWGASSPFFYFTDMPPVLGQQIYAGRKREVVATEFATADEAGQMPDPQAEETFRRSKLDWGELEKPEHRRILDLYRAGLKLRHELFGRRNPAREHFDTRAMEDGAVIHYRINHRKVSVYLYLKKVTKLPAGKIILRSSAPEFGGSPSHDSGLPETIVVEE